MFYQWLAQISLIAQEVNFFIMLDDAPHLDGNYAAFGKVISGMDIAHQIEEAGLNHGSITIEEMSVETYGVDYQEPEIMN